MTTMELERELREFWCEYEAAVGFKSTFSAMLAAHQGVSLGSGPPAGWDPYAEVIDRITAGSRTYRALRRMGTTDVVVLWRLFGPRNAHHDLPALGDLSPLAELTTAAEDAREALVLRESTRRSDGVGARVEADMVRRRDELAALFWREARVLARPTTDERRAEAGRAFLGQLLAAYGADGSIRARIGAIESTDREITVGAAVRARIKDRAFVAEVTREAANFRSTALSSYRVARSAELEHVHEKRRERIRRQSTYDLEALSGAA